MSKYISHVSQEDFKLISTNLAYSELTNAYPQVVAMISDKYPALPNNKPKTVHIDNVKHVYSTRDYWEVLVVDGSRHKIPKRYTDAIYLIEED